jgi:FtsZ-binding cell division protein ZapB
MKNNLKQVHDLELEVLELKRNNQELEASMESLKCEKHKLQRELDTALDEKKKHLDRISELNIIGT